MTDIPDLSDDLKVHRRKNNPSLTEAICKETAGVQIKVRLVMDNEQRGGTIGQPVLSGSPACCWYSSWYLGQLHWCCLH